MPLLSADDLRRLASLRAAFLHGDATSPSRSRDYWNDDQDLELYDRFLGARIGMKWDAVLDELALLAPIPSSATILDWACGTGVAARRYLDRAPAGVRVVRLWDRSSRAMAFARDRVSRRHPEIAVELAEGPAAVDVLLVSHVLSELDAAGEEALLEQMKLARTILWVESGERATSRRLSVCRQRLLDVGFAVLAPCPHQRACGALADERNWCHHFAPAPASVFQDAEWAQVARTLSIDLRSLPHAFLVLERGAARGGAKEARLLGRPDGAKGVTRLHVCDATGVHALELLRRTSPAWHRRLAKGPLLRPMLDIHHDGRRILEIAPPPNDASDGLE